MAYLLAVYFLMIICFHLAHFHISPLNEETGHFIMWIMGILSIFIMLGQLVDIYQITSGKYIYFKKAKK